MKIRRPSTKTVLLIVVVVIFTIVLSTLVATLLDRSQNIHVPSFGTIYTLGYDAYGGDLTGTNGNRTVDWGTIFPGASVNRSFYLQSKSNVPTIPMLIVANWTFKNSQGQTIGLPQVNITITWNINGRVVNPDEAFYATLSMQVPNSAEFINYLVDDEVTAFSVDIQISPLQT
jgi:hypothetical protein